VRVPLPLLPSRCPPFLPCGRRSRQRDEGREDGSRRVPRPNDRVTVKKKRELFPRIPPAFRGSVSVATILQRTDGEPPQRRRGREKAWSRNINLIPFRQLGGQFPASPSFPPAGPAKGPRREGDRKRQRGGSNARARTEAQQPDASRSSPSAALRLKNRVFLCLRTDLPMYK